MTPRESRPRFQPLALAVLALAAACALHTAVALLGDFRSPYENSYPETNMWFFALRMAKGLTVYQSVGGEGHNAFPYGPLAIAPVAGLARVLDLDWRGCQLAGRCLSMVALAGLVAAGLWRAARVGLAPLLAAAILLAGLAQYGIIGFAASFRPDFPALALEIAAIACALSAQGRRRPMFALATSGALAGAAFLVKPSLVVAYAGVSLAMLCRPVASVGRAAGFAVQLGAATLVVVAAILALVPAPRMLCIENLLASRYFPFDREMLALAFRLNASHLALAAIPIGAACVAVVRAAGASRVEFVLGCALGLSAAVQTAALLKVGASAVYWAEPLALGLWLSIETGRRAFDGAPAGVAGRVLLVAALLAGAHATWMDGLRLAHYRMPEVDAGMEDLADLSLGLQRLPRPILSDNPDVFARAPGEDFPLATDALFANALNAAGAATLEPVTSRLHARTVGAVVLGFDPRIEREGHTRAGWPEAWRAAIVSNYRPAGELHQFQVWLPKP